MAWKDYCPFVNGEYNTIWELARQLYDQHVNNDGTGDERTVIGTTALPYLVRWLFTSDGVQSEINYLTPEWSELVRQFITVYLNREIGYINPYVFRSNLMRVIYQYKDFIESTANKLYLQINSDSGSLKESGKRDSTENSEQSNSNTTVSDTSVDSTHSTTGELTGESDTSDSSTSESSGTSSVTGNNNTSENSYNRQLVSNTPQSIVNASSTGNPSDIKWTYASALQDDINNHTLNNTNTQNTENSDTSSASGTSKNTSKQNNKTDGTDSSNSNTNITNNGSTEYGKTYGETYSNERDVISPYNLSVDKYKFFIDNMRKPLYIVINELGKLFISQYVDEERLGYLEWSEYDNLLNKIYERS